MITFLIISGVRQGSESPLRQIVLRLGELVIEIGQAQLFQFVAAVGGGKQIGGYLRVKNEARRADPLLQKGAAQALDSMPHLFNISGKQTLQKIIVTVQLVGKECSCALLPLDTNRVQVRCRKYIYFTLFSPQPKQFLHTGTLCDHL